MNTLSFPDYDLIAEQASTWVAKIDCGLCDKSQQNLSEWLHESSAHGEALIKYASMWDMLDVLEPIAKILPIDGVEGELSVDDDVVRLPVDERLASRFGYAIAASTIAALAIIFFNLNSNQQSEAQTQITEFQDETKAIAAPIVETYATQIGENRNLVLSDGSELTLNTNTEVSVEFSGTLRKVVISKGEVYFDIAKNPARPFVAVTSDSSVTAVGTAFNIELDALNGTEVLVTEGRVKVDNFSKIQQDNSQASAEVFLTKGQKALIREQQAQVSAYDGFESALAWREGMIVFTGETLEQAVREIDRYTPLSFKIIDDEISSIQVGGFFQTGDMEQLLLILEQNFGIKSRREGQQILLSKA